LEYVGHRGSFRNTTVEGQITGQGLDIGIVDDPIKGRAEANNKAVRDKTWGWFTDDFFTRFSDSAGLLMIMTRWHLDDPVGRFSERFPEAKVLRYPAIAEKDETHRRKGEALFPQHKSLPFLIERRAAMTQASWESVYQQNPIPVGGGLFPIEQMKIVPAINRDEIKRSVRYWDKAGTADGGAFTVGALMHWLYDGRFVIDVRRGQWAALDREKVIKSTAEIDSQTFPSHFIWVEQEPGSSGRESAEATIRMLAGFKVKADRVTGNKEDRAQPYAAQVQGRERASALRRVEQSIPGRARDVSRWQVQGSGRRCGGRVQQGDERIDVRHLAGLGGSHRRSARWLAIDCRSCPRSGGFAGTGRRAGAILQGRAQLPPTMCDQIHTSL
jgi:phage terminase large subunit-like protein